MFVIDLRLADVDHVGKYSSAALYDNFYYDFQLKN